MKKIFITGNAGSGKSTLGRIVSDKTGYDLIGLDQFVWRPYWKRVERDIVCKNIDAILKRDTWVIEGVSSYVLKQADVVIFLDVSRPKALIRVMRRNWRYLFKSRPGLPEHCPEIKIIFTLFKVIWQFKNRVRPAIIKIIEESDNKKLVFYIRTPREFNQLLQTIEKW